MTTTTTAIQGSDWSDNRLYENWGEIPESESGQEPDYEATYQKCGDLVVAKFHSLVRDVDPTLYWNPQLSRVDGEIKTPATGDSFEMLYSWPDNFDLEGIREEAYEVVYNQWINGEIDPIFL